MKTFITEDFLLETDLAQTLYHEHAKDMPIIAFIIFRILLVGKTIRSTFDPVRTDRPSAGSSDQSPAAALRSVSSRADIRNAAESPAYRNA